MEDRLTGSSTQMFEDDRSKVYHHLVTTARDVERGQDPQNIPWDRLEVSRSKYRVEPAFRSYYCLYASDTSTQDHTSIPVQETRIQQYQNYVNLRDIFEQNHEKLKQESVSVSKVLLSGLISLLS